MNSTNHSLQLQLELADPAQTVAKIVSFIQKTYQHQGKSEAVIAVSGGLDSAVSLTLLVQALGASQVTALFLPYGDQDMTDAVAVTEFNQVPSERVQSIDIQPLVDTAAATLNLSAQPAPTSQPDRSRLGNLMARARMMTVYDTAKRLDALVCGTENQSEKFLAYFTRFGDEASDLEPIQHLFKTQVRQLATYLEIPNQIITKSPSAGLWANQTDESELGFSYEVADQVMAAMLDEHGSFSPQPNQEAISHLDPTVVQQVIDHIRRNHFKHVVPYVLGD